MLLTFPFTFIFLRQMHHSAQSLFHHNLDRILTHFGDIQRLGNGIRGCTVRNNCRAETPLLFGNFYYIPFKLPVGM